MAITLMFITNRPEVAKIAQEAGVDRIWVDLEINGKEERQAGMNTVKSKHTMEDITTIKRIVTTSQLMVRINPLYDKSKQEVDEVIERGAEYIMLPMYKTVEDVRTFISFVNGRSKIILLLETPEAEKNLENYINLSGIDEIHIGLNDLNLAYNNKFMFELLSNGTIERLSEVMNKHKMKFGFGGFARIGHGMLPAEYILAEHYHYGSQMSILSRGFCDINSAENPEAKRDEFINGVKNIRLKEVEIQKYTAKEFEENKKRVVRIVQDIVSNMK